jgi:serine/threonine-protein kinase
LIHRDIKPQNVLVWGAGRTDEHAFLTDFGIAKAINETSSITGMGILGTPAYMAPELWQGETVTPATDQYALACVLFELIDGSGPFRDDDDPRYQHLVAQPRQLGDSNSRVGGAVSAAVNRALSKSPVERFPTVRAFAEAAGDVSSAAFRNSSDAATVLAGADGASQRITELVEQVGYSEAVATEVATLTRDEVVRLRRQATRRALMDE